MTSFQVYAFFALALIAVAKFKFPDAMRKRDRLELLTANEEYFGQLITQE